MASTQAVFERWAKDQGIKIKGVVPTRFPGHGLGLAAARDIKPEELLIKVPTDAILSIDAVPSNFRGDLEAVNSRSTKRDGLPLKGRGHNVTTHAILAAYLAFHSESPLDVKQDNSNWVGNHHPWSLTWPTPLDFVVSMPLFWGKGLRQEYCQQCKKILDSSFTCEHGSEMDSLVSLLPPIINSMVAKQQQKLDQDWQDVLDAQVIDKYQTDATARSPFEFFDGSELFDVPRDSKARFNYAWSVVNTRCFYYTTPHSPAPEKSFPASPSSSTSTVPSPASSPRSINPDDCMALVPFLDLFNHVSSPLPFSTHSSSALDVSNKSPIPCTVNFDSDFYNLTSPASTTLKSGSEVYVSYGAHPQDFLFAEYGFILPPHSNDDDFLPLDPRISQDLDADQKIQLEEVGFWGEWSLYPSKKTGEEAEVCFRTQVVAIMVGTSSKTSPTSKPNATSPPTSARKKRKKAHASKQPTHLQEGPPEESYWSQYLNGTLDLDIPTETNANIRSAANGTIRSWISRYLMLADRTVDALKSIEHEGEGGIVRVFANGLLECMNSVRANGKSGRGGDAEEKNVQERRIVALATQRLHTLLSRWIEIREICESAKGREDWF